MPNIYSTSDQHFTHMNIIKYAERPFDLSEQGIKDCINHIVNEYNSIIKDDDLVIHLGDLSHGRNQSKEVIRYIMEAHKGRKILIKGNHDNYSDEFYKSLFESVGTYLIMDEYFFCHYPLYENALGPFEKELFKVFKNSGCKTIVHGHTHNKDSHSNDGIQRINVSVDYTPNNFKPVKINFINNNKIGD